MKLTVTHQERYSRIKASLSYETAGNFEALYFDIDWKRVKEALK